MQKENFRTLEVVTKIAEAITKYQWLPGQLDLKQSYVQVYICKGALIPQVSCTLQFHTTHLLHPDLDYFS